MNASAWQPTVAQQTYTAHQTWPLVAAQQAAVAQQAYAAQQTALDAQEKAAHAAASQQYMAAQQAALAHQAWNGYQAAATAAGHARAQAASAQLAAAQHKAAAEQAFAAHHVANSATSSSVPYWAAAPQLPSMQPAYHRAPPDPTASYYYAAPPALVPPPLYHGYAQPMVGPAPPAFVGLAPAAAHPYQHVSHGKTAVVGAPTPEQHQVARHGALQAEQALLEACRRVLAQR